VAGTLVLLVSACGGGGGGTSGASSSQPSATVYRAQLRKIAKESLAAQTAALQASSVQQLVTVVKAYVAADRRIGAEIAALNPPADAEAANSEFAKGFQDEAAELEALLPKIKKMPSAKAVNAYLSKGSRTAKSDYEIRHAHAKLLRLGYMTKGE
jgi:hypothetical protein